MIGRETTGATIARRLRRRPVGHRRTMEQRLRALAPQFPAESDSPLEALVGALVAWLDDTSADRVWLALAALRAQLPTEEEVVEAQRSIALNGAGPWVVPIILPAGIGALAGFIPGRPIELVSDQVLVDVEHTARVAFATGIQRVVRGLLGQWTVTHDFVAVGWTRDRTALRRLHPQERVMAITGSADPPPPPNGWRGDTALIPVSATYLLPELNVDVPSMRRLAALARFSLNRTGVLGFDLVPIGSGETGDHGMPAAFAFNLAAVKWMDAVAAISESAAEEYLGWREMLSAIGLRGPSVGVATLPTEAPPVEKAAVAEAWALLVIDGLPLLLCVGSHEPRKNHVAILHSAEVLWREGLSFCLAFVGGNAWRSEEFMRRVAELQAAGRPLRTVRALPDRLLWGAYVASRAVLFPSFSEGFGLPVAESLASGVPVITSGFGSMAAIAASGGAIFVDPRDDRSITDAMRSVLVDEHLYAELRHEAATFPSRGWGPFAEHVWQILVGDPDQPPA